MSSRISFNVRLTEKELVELKESLPGLPDISNMSDLFRTAAKEFIKSEHPTSSLALGPLETVIEQIHAAQNLIMSEIKKTDSKVDQIFSLLKDQAIQSVERLNQEYVQQLLNLWLSDLDTLSTYSTLEELEESLSKPGYSHLADIQDVQDIVFDAIKILKQSKRVEIEKSGKLRWIL
ncbi:MAG: hypothetical protein HeimC2_37770 [Candidatus Heimdallarchaeota archaeon LC_2]|nr:MAG: hypothetical protein HeimC2_37770 [Candidatus Heimdallarchaeota archaeon LC_2]